MYKWIQMIVFVLILTAVIMPPSNAYDIPQRKIEIKPYVNVLFASDFWTSAGDASVIDDKTGIGFGVKVRNQFRDRFGMMLNVSYTGAEALDNSSGDVVMFTVGGYYAWHTSFGNFIFDCGYGVVGAADEALGLLMPSLEYNRMVTERMMLSLEAGWPIPNDWLSNFDFEENYGSFTLSVGSSFVF